MLPRSYNQNLFVEKSQGADIAVVEGVMGLFDGFSGTDEAGSTAQMAKWLNLPVLLVISAGGMARSAAAIVKGFETFDPDLKLAGVIFSKTGSLRHYQYLKEAVEQTCSTKCIGYMPKNDEIVMPERHLGLVTADENKISKETKKILSSMVRDHMDIPGFLDSLPELTMKNTQPGKELDTNQIPEIDHRTPNRIKGSKKPVIAVARDKAFCFYYRDNLEILEKMGAELIEFSPINDDRLQEEIDGIYLGGGYPEVFAEQLSQNRQILQQIKKFSKAGMPIYGECGGFMFLCSTLCSAEDNKEYNMAGCFDFKVRMSTRLRSLGYREIRLSQDTLVGKKGEVIRGHEFHYSSVEKPEGLSPGTDRMASDIYQVTSRAGQDLSLKGYQVFNTLGSYMHIHFGSNLNSPKAFIQACRIFKDKKQSDI